MRLTPQNQHSQSFKLFVALWNQRQNQTTPNLHFRIADWLEISRRSQNHHLLLMAFRSSGKSTIVGLFAAWLLYTDPNLRILVLAADHGLAQKMVRNVKRILEKHPLTTDLKPEKADQWASGRFTVKRTMELRDPSMLACGVTSNITGSRADVILCDDVEVPNTCDSYEKRRILRERLTELRYVLVPRGTQIYVGTPHTLETIYDTDENGFMHGFDSLKIPALTEDGHSQWPERFSRSELDKIRLHTGPNKFASQMMLRPVNIAEGRLDESQLRFYPQSLLQNTDNKEYFVSTWWDPAFGKQGGDASVLAILMADRVGNYYLDSLDYIRVNEASEQDEATQQCMVVARRLKEYAAKFLALEINGIGRFLPGLLRKELQRHGIDCAIREVSSRRPKDIRILEAFDAVLAARCLHVREALRSTPFLSEMRDWKPGRNGGHDDGLDAVAGAISNVPLRSDFFLSSPSKLKARTDFDPYRKE